MMNDEPKTAMAVMTMDFEAQRLEARDRRLATAIGKQMVETFFDPEIIQDMRDVREQIMDAAQQAAYEAIQKEREMHAGDMAALKAFSDARVAEIMLRPPSQTIVPGPDIRP